ncbi:MAG: hypothetical protein AAF394_08515 [Planctomycetota bacterium]
MPIAIGNDVFKFESMLMSGGKERLTINGQKAHEGVIPTDSPLSLTVGEKEFEILKEGKAYRMRKIVQGEVVSEGLYNSQGMQVDNPERAANANAASICGIVGMFVGFTLMMVGNFTTGVVPGGAVGGAIGGGLGAALGTAIGKALFVKE